MRQIFLDTETTGLNPESGDRIVEIGCVEMVGRRLTGDNRHYYLNPQRASHPDALKVHGLTEEFLAGRPGGADAVEDAVREYLAQQGVDAGRLQASGKGSSDLANSSDPYAAENRRVRIVNLN